MGFWGGKGREGASLLARPGQRPLASPGTFVVGHQTQILWPSRGRVEWPRTKSLTSVSSWPRQWL